MRILAAKTGDFWALSVIYRNVKLSAVSTELGPRDSNLKNVE